MKDIKVSIITVCYNSEKTIEQTIQSVLKQSYKNIEYIIVDGGSTDGTLDIIKKYEKDFDYWMSEPDNGIYDAMNKGILKATGDVIGFINSDDWYANGAITAIADAFSKTDADIVYGKLTVVMEDGRRRLFQRGKLDDICIGITIGHPATFVKTEDMKECLFDCTYKIAADYAFLLEMYLQGKHFCPIDAMITFFRLGGASSHPWKPYLEVRKAALQLTQERVSNERYKEIRAAFRKRRFLPLFHFLRYKMQNIQRRKKEGVVNLISGKSFVLYGAGKLGIEVLKIMKEWRGFVSVFWDGDAEKQGTEIGGKSILSPQHKTKQDKKTTILITTVKDNIVIAQKLEEIGYEGGRDFFDKEEWLRWIAGMWLGRCR